MAPTLEELLNSGLGGILQSGGAPLEEDLYQRQAQAERESTFGRGLGISSVTRDALAKARMDAAMSAQQAQLAALGQAAGITQQNANRAQQESQFGRSQSQQMEMQKRALNQQQGMANQQMLAGGIGAGVGALGMLGGAAIRGPYSRGGGGQGGGGGGGQGGGGSVPAEPYVGGPSPMPQFSDPTGAGGGASLGALQDFTMPSQDFSMPSFNFDTSMFAGPDLSSFYDFDPYQVQDWGWY